MKKSWLRNFPEKFSCSCFHRSCCPPAARGGGAGVSGGSAYNSVHLKKLFLERDSVILTGPPPPDGLLSFCRKTHMRSHGPISFSQEVQQMIDSSTSSQFTFKLCGWKTINATPTHSWLDESTHHCAVIGSSHKKLLRLLTASCQSNLSLPFFSKTVSLWAESWFSVVNSPSSCSVDSWCLCPAWKRPVEESSSVFMFVTEWN